MDFYTLRLKAGFNSRKKAAKFFKVHERTVRNWEKRNQAPEAVIKCLSILSRDLSNFGKAWKNVYLAEDCLMTSKKDFIYPHEIPAIRQIFNQAGIDRSKFFYR